jgi:hypothetical protein
MKDIRQEMRQLPHMISQRNITMSQYHQGQQQDHLLNKRTAANPCSANQAVGFPSLHSIITLPKTYAIPSNPFTSGAEIQFRIHHDQIKRVGGLSFRMQVQESAGSSSMILAPMPHWFDRIELWSLSLM